MSEVEVAWVAGLLEGEGCFGLGPYKTTGTRQIRITCAMTDEDTIQKLMDTVGFGNYNKEGRKDPRRLAYSKPLYVWSATKRSDVVELMNLIRPYMSIRRGQKIDELLKYAEENPLKNTIKGEGVPHGTRNGYRWHKCKCELCMEAMRNYARDYRARKKAARAALD